MRLEVPGFLAAMMVHAPPLFAHADGAMCGLAHACRSSDVQHSDGARWVAGSITRFVGDVPSPLAGAPSALSRLLATLSDIRGVGSQLSRQDTWWMTDSIEIMPQRNLSS